MAGKSGPSRSRNSVRAAKAATCLREDTFQPAWHSRSLQNGLTRDVFARSFARRTFVQVRALLILAVRKSVFRLLHSPVRMPRLAPNRSEERRVGKGWRGC